MRNLQLIWGPGGLTCEAVEVAPVSFALNDTEKLILALFQPNHRIRCKDFQRPHTGDVLRMLVRKNCLLKFPVEGTAAFEYERVA